MLLKRSKMHENKTSIFILKARNFAQNRVSMMTFYTLPGIIFYTLFQSVFAVSKSFFQSSERLTACRFSALPNERTPKGSNARSRRFFGTSIFYDESESRIKRD